jgi:hypothetical protein
MVDLEERVASVVMMEEMVDWVAMGMMEVVLWVVVAVGERADWVVRMAVG